MGTVREHVMEEPAAEEMCIRNLDTGETTLICGDPEHDPELFVGSPDSESAELVIRNLDTGGSVTVKQLEEVESAAIQGEVQTGKMGYIYKKGQDKKVMGFNKSGT